jgi:hypothetical protein
MKFWVSKLFRRGRKSDLPVIDATPCTPIPECPPEPQPVLPLTDFEECLALLVAHPPVVPMDVVDLIFSLAFDRPRTYFWLRDAFATALDDPILFLRSLPFIYHHGALRYLLQSHAALDLLFDEYLPLLIPPKDPPISLVLVKFEFCEMVSRIIIDGYGEDELYERVQRRLFKHRITTEPLELQARIYRLLTENFCLTEDKMPIVHADSLLLHLVRSFEKAPEFRMPTITFTLDHASVVFEYAPLATILADRGLCDHNLLPHFVTVLNRSGIQCSSAASRKILSLTRHEVYGKLCLHLIATQLNPSFFEFGRKAQILREFLWTILDLLRIADVIGSESREIELAKDAIVTLYRLNFGRVRLMVTDYLAISPNLTRLFEPKDSSDPT